MARAIDVDVLANKIMEIWDRAENEGRTDIANFIANIIVPCIVGTPTIEPKQEWISVKDRPPEENNVIEGRKHETCSDLVIVFVRDDLGNSFTCDDMTMNGEWINYPAPQFKVTHWMPLPEPPKED